jgi:ABC-type branched-subunit amino acid transport system substrate-binding protein
MAKKTVREHTKAEILQRVFNGEKIYKLAEEFNFSIQAIYMWVRDAKGSKTKAIIIKDKSTFEPITEAELKKFKAQQGGNLMLRYNDVKCYNNFNRNME